MVLGMNFLYVFTARGGAWEGEVRGMGMNGDCIEEGVRGVG